MMDAPEAVLLREARIVRRDAVLLGRHRPSVGAPARGVLQGEGVPVARGVFGARMEVSLVNDRPVTIVLDI